MDDKKLYEEINNTMFQNGSCTLNQWYLINIINEEGKVLTFEAIYPSKGNIKIRIPVAKHGMNYENEMVYKYKQFRFTNKKELKNDGYVYDTKPESYANI